VSSAMKSTGAVVAGFFTVFVLSLVTDQVLHMLKVYPPWGQSMSSGLFLLATSYRLLYTVLGGYLTARLAPHTPLRHAVILGLVGTAAGIAGVVATINKPELGPAWYPIVLAVTAFPATWLGGFLYERRAGQ